MRLVNLTEYTELPRPNIGWLLPKLLPKPGITVLLGAPKAGKSYLALQIALAMAQGRDFLGQRAPRLIRTLYLQLDTSEPIWRERLSETREAGYDLTGDVFMVHPEDQMKIDVLQEASRQWVTQALDACQPDVVIVDVLRECHNADENDNSAMKRVGDRLVELFGAYCLILLHHTRKIPDEVTDPNPLTVSRGASYVTGKADSVWLLHGHRLKIVPRFAEASTWEAQRDPTGFWSFPEATQVIERVKLAFKLCEEYPTWSHSQLAPLAKDRHGWSKSTYMRILQGQSCPHVKVKCA